MTTRHDEPLPAVFADVELVDGPTAARVGGMSVSWWHEEVRAGRAPQPARRQPRCTRWRAIDVRDFWQRFAAECTADARVVTAATKASAKAREMRAGAAA